MPPQNKVLLLLIHYLNQFNLDLLLHSKLKKDVHILKINKIKTDPEVRVLGIEKIGKIMIEMMIQMVMVLQMAIEIKTEMMI